jgi:DNA polymerase IV
MLPRVSAATRGGEFVMFVSYLYLDMNAYFASVEQQLRPELRGRPVAVAPVMAETTCCIAASYEAKAFGVKTGTRVSDARRMCPGLRVVEARPRVYMEVHNRMLAAVDTCLPVASVRSIDEVVCKLIGRERDPDEAERIALRMKAAMRRDLGPYLRCSIGLGPNVLLSKIAADMRKPDGLTTLRPNELPDRLHVLELRDIPGVGHRMERRLLALGITTVEQLCAQPVAGLARVWNSRLLGDVWHRNLRGEDIPEPPHPRRSLGHSHVLAPEWRTDAGARAVLLRLVEKAAARLRSINHWTDTIRISVSIVNGPHWSDFAKLGWCQDTLALVRAAVALWAHRPAGTPLKVGVVFDDLRETRNVAVPLLAQDREELALAQAMDRINKKFGVHAVHLGGMHGAQDQAPSRIAFGRLIDLDGE